MTDSHDHGLGTALHDRVADVHPDLDHLAAASMRAGARIRRRRAAGVSLAAATGVAVIGVVGAQLSGGGSTVRDAGLGFAAQPSASATPGAACAADGRIEINHGRMPTAPKGQTPPTYAQPDLQPVCGPEAVVLPPAPQQLPVRVKGLAGWQIDAPGDDKFPVSKGDYHLSVNVRHMDEYAGWSGNDPDRPASQVAHVGENYFVTVQPNPDVPAHVVAELKKALRYDPVWDEDAAAAGVR